MSAQNNGGNGNLDYQHGARYLGQPTRWGLCESKEKKTPQFYISFKVVGQIDPMNPEGDLLSCPEGERTAFWYLTDAAIDNLIRDLADMGATGDFPAMLEQNGPASFPFDRLQLVFSCKHEQYQGKWRDKWEYGSGGSFNPLPLDQREVARLAALYGRKFDKLRPHVQAQRPSQPVRPANGQPDQPAQPVRPAPRPVAGPAPAHVPQPTGPATGDIPF